MQIARLAYSKSMKKCEGVVQERKLFGTEELSLGGPIGDVSRPQGIPTLFRHLIL
jgi:hypothetical protein